MASQINLGSQSAQKSYDDLKLVIGNLTNQMHLGTDEQGQLLNALERTVDSGGTAQDAYNNVMAAEILRLLQEFSQRSSRMQYRLQRPA